MNINLLRSKMALKGHFTWVDLCELLELSRPALIARLDGTTAWKLPEMQKIIQFYDISEEEACEIFGLRNDHED